MVSYFLGICYVFVPSYLCNKFDDKVVKCIFMGYNSQRKGQKYCYFITRKCYTSRDIVFHEAILMVFR